MTKKERRRCVAPSWIDPQPQSTWAPSPGANASVRNAGWRTGRTCYTYCLRTLSRLRNRGPHGDVGRSAWCCKDAVPASTDPRFERVEFAAALHRTARTVPIGTGIFGGRFQVDCQLACDLRETQATFAVVETDFAVSLVVDHGCAFIRRRISTIGSASLVRGDAGGNDLGPTPCCGSRLRT